MKNIIFLSNLTLTSALLFWATSLNAQKLPDIQNKSLRAPANVKIDGKPAEWGDQFQSYNKNTNIFYLVSNDNERLYLAVKVIDKNIIDKIVQGGITFTINGSDKMKDQNGAAITFPAYQKSDPLFRLNLNKPDLADKNTSELETFIVARNKMLTSNLGIIGISGIKEIKDSIISIYNEEGIKAASLLDNKMAYTCEFAIPLKYLKLDTNSGNKFVYNIKLNGTTATGTDVKTNYAGRDMISYTGRDGKSYVAGRSTPENIALAFPTDFWGEYSLTP